MPNNFSFKDIRLLALGQSLIEHDLRAQPYPGLQPLVERLKKADVCFSNFEGTLKGANDDAASRQGVFLHGASPDVLDCLKELSINLLSLGNNHSFDWGADGIRVTIAEAQWRGFVCAGTGMNLADANSPAQLRLPQGVVELVACASKTPEGSAATNDQAGVNPLRLMDECTLDRQDSQRILDSIQQASRTANLVIAYHHDHYWAPNRQDTPQWKVQWARACIDAGASVYISHGVPLLHGIEIYRGHPIFYGLGNFIFHTRTPISKYEPTVWQGMIADCVFRDGQINALCLEAITLNEAGEAGDNFLKTRGRPTMATGALAQGIYERFAGLCGLFGTRMTIHPDHAQIELES